MDPSGMMNEGAPFNMSEIWQFPMNGDSSARAFAVPHSNLTTTATVAGDQARVSHALSQAVIEGISGAWKRREDESDSAKVGNCNGANECDNKRRKIDEVCDGKGEEGSPETNMDQKKQQIEPMRDYIHVRARRGQATDSHSLAERARREKISERMKILQDLVPGCNKFLSMKLEAVNSRMNPCIEVFPPKEFGQQAFENPEMQFRSQSRREYSRGASPEWLHMQIGSGGFERPSS